MSEENKVIDKVNTSEIVEQPVDAEEIPPVKTEAIPPVNTEPTQSFTATGRTGAEAGRLLQRDCGGSCS